MKIIDNMLAEAKLKGEKIMPGMYLYDSQCFIDTEEMCDHYGFPHTQESIQFLREQLMELANKVSPGAEWTEEKKGPKADN